MSSDRLTSLTPDMPRTADKNAMKMGMGFSTMDEMPALN